VTLFAQYVTARANGVPKREDSMIDPAKLQTLQFISIVIGVVHRVIGFLNALWKTGLWFGAWTTELHAVGQKLDEGFERNDTAHDLIHENMSVIGERLNEHGERIASLEGGQRGAKRKFVGSPFTPPKEGGEVP